MRQHVYGANTTDMVAFRSIDPKRIAYLRHLHKTGRIKQDTDTITEPLPTFMDVEKSNRWVVTIFDVLTGEAINVDVEAETEREAIERASLTANFLRGWLCVGTRSVRRF